MFIHVFTFCCMRAVCLFYYSCICCTFSFVFLSSYFFPFSRLIFHMNASHALYIPNVCDFFFVLFIYLFIYIFFSTLTLLVTLCGYQRLCVLGLHFFFILFFKFLVHLEHLNNNSTKKKRKKKLQ